MTKLMTAEEFAERVRNKSCSGFPKWTIPLIRDVQRDALEAAAKAQCWNCQQGYAVDRSTSTVWRHMIGALSVPCEATEIYDLIPKDPAPADATQEMEREHEQNRRQVASEGSL